MIFFKIYSYSPSSNAAYWGLIIARNERTHRYDGNAFCNSRGINKKFIFGNIIDRNDKTFFKFRSKIEMERAIKIDII